MPTAVRPIRSVPAAAELAALGREQGLDAVGVAPAAAFATTRRHLERRRAGGLHGGMAFTYRAPTRSCDPAAALPGARALVVAALGYRRVAPPAVGTDPALADRGAGAGTSTDDATDGGGPGARATTPDAPASARPAGRVARYAWDDHYRDLRTALTVVAGHIRSLGWRARVVADDNALVDREAAYRAGLGWYGKNANLLLLPGEGSWFVLGSVITDAPVPPTGPRVEDGCGTCTRCLDGCPTGAI